MTRSALVIVSASASALVAAGCGGSAHTRSASTPAVSEAAMKHQTAKATKSGETASAKGATVKVVSSQFGPIVADAHGQALYLFTKEKSSQSRCYGRCANSWPPAITKGRPSGRSGARSMLLGTTRRSDGKLQLTYAGHPLYYYRGDSPGRVLCQDVNEFGGLWLVVRPNGTAVR